MARCETNCLGAILCPVSCLPQRMLHGKVKMKKMEEESRAVELALEGHSLFISGLCCAGKCFRYSKIIIFIFLIPLLHCCRLIVYSDC